MRQRARHSVPGRSPRWYRSRRAGWGACASIMPAESVAASASPPTKPAIGAKHRCLHVVREQAHGRPSPRCKRGPSHWRDEGVHGERCGVRTREQRGHRGVAGDGEALTPRARRGRSPLRLQRRPDALLGPVAEVACVPRQRRTEPRQDVCAVALLRVGDACPRELLSRGEIDQRRRDRCRPQVDARNERDVGDLVLGRRA